MLTKAHSNRPPCTRAARLRARHHRTALACSVATGALHVRRRSPPGAGARRGAVCMRRRAVLCIVQPFLVDPIVDRPVLGTDGQVWGGDATQTSAQAKRHGCEHDGGHVPGMPKPGGAVWARAVTGVASLTRAAAPGGLQKRLCSRFLDGMLVPGRVSTHYHAPHHPVQREVPGRHLRIQVDKVLTTAHPTLGRGAPCPMRHPTRIRSRLLVMLIACWCARGVCESKLSLRVAVQARDPPH